MGAKMKIVTAQEVAAVLKLKEGTVCSLALRGKLPGFKVGKSWRFDMDKVERLFPGIPRGGKDRPKQDNASIGEEEQ